MGACLGLLILSLLLGCSSPPGPTVPTRGQLSAIEAAHASPGAVLEAALSAMTDGDFVTFYLLLDPGSQQRQLLGVCEDASWHLVTKVIDENSNVDREVDKVSEVLERYGRDPDAVDGVVESLGDLSAARLHVVARKRLAAIYARDPGHSAGLYADLMKMLGRAKPVRTAQREVTDLRITGDEAHATIVDVNSGRSWPASFVRLADGWHLVTEESVSTELDRLGVP